MTELWGSIDPTQWRDVSAISGRIATEADVVAGRAVFCIEGDSEPYSLSLPVCAIQRMEDGSEEKVVVVQAEVGPECVIVGVRPLDGGNGICTLSELRILDAGFDGGPSVVV